MKITVQSGSILDIHADAIIVNLLEGVTRPEGATAAVDKFFEGYIDELLARENFEGKVGQTLVIHTHEKLPCTKVIVTGLGEIEKLTLESLRKSSAAALRVAQKSNCQKVATIVHGAGTAGLEPVFAAQATVEGALIGTYSFDKYKTSKDKRYIEEMVIVERDVMKLAEIEEGVTRGQIVAEAVNEARNLISEPANVVNPAYLADLASQISEETGLALTILEREDCEKLGMGAYLGVSQGSTQPPKFIALNYKSDKSEARTVAIIGKGITFDTGGYSIKPADSMFGMKDDMSGAAAVLATMRAVTQLKPAVNILGIVAATENMISGEAYRPGDIVTAMNGKTIEVENTDAEGRLTLADALCYAVKNGADEMIDLATLTGACVVALGRGLSGLFCNNESLSERLVRCGEISGDLLWPMPLHADYFEQIKSDVADMKNTGGREAGATTAALLLEQFVDNKPWAHIDIAGPAYLKADNGLISKGAAGAGVRLLLEYLCGDAALPHE